MRQEKLEGKEKVVQEGALLLTVPPRSSYAGYSNTYVRGILTGFTQYTTKFHRKTEDFQLYFLQR